MSSYGVIFSSSLAAQGCVMNSVGEMFRSGSWINLGFYLAGPLICCGVLMDLGHSIVVNP